MRILHVINTLSPAAGGPPEAVRQLVKAYSLELDNAEVEVVCLDDPDDSFLTGIPCTIHALGQTSLGRYAFSPRLWRWLQMHVHRFDALIMNGIWSFPGIALQFAARRSRKRYAVFVHGALDPWFNRKYPLKHLKKILYWITVNYREAYHMHASNGILFNHESPIRGETFVTRKISRAVAAIHLGVQKALYIGNLDSKRDWGHARDYVDGMWRMLQQETPDDYVLATGEAHTVREFVEMAFLQVGRHIEWKGKGLDEVGIETSTGEAMVKIDSRYFRPTEVDTLLGDPSKAHRVLEWKHSVTFPELVSEMVSSDLMVIAKELQIGERSHE